MVIKNAKDFFINKIIFPNVLITDRPGVIISKTLGIFGNRKRRMIYDFEDIFASLQRETLAELGNGRASDLFYKIGKDVGTQYSFFFSKQKIPTLFLQSFINYTFSRLASVGMSFAKFISFDPKNISLVLEGEENIICRQTGNASMFAGLVSGVLSSLCGENIEAEAKCIDCSKKCRIEANRDISVKYLPSLKEIAPLKNYDSLNFPSKINLPSKLPALNDFYNFKKIIHKDTKFYFKGRVLFFSEANMPGIVAKNYEDNKKLFENATIKSAESLALDLFRETGKTKNKLNYLQGLLSAFGWGVPYYYKRESNQVIFKFLYSPINRYGSLYQALELNGFLNAIFNKKFRIKSLETKYNPVVTEITYS